MELIRDIFAFVGWLPNSIPLMYGFYIIYSILLGRYKRRLNELSGSTISNTQITQAELDGATAKATVRLIPAIIFGIAYYVCCVMSFFWLVNVLFTYFKSQT